MADDEVMAGSEEAAEITDEEAQPVEAEAEEAVEIEGDAEDETEDEDAVEEYELNLFGNRHAIPMDVLADERAREAVEALQQYARKAEATVTERGQANSEQAKALEAMRSEVETEREAVQRVKQLDDEAFGLYAQGRSIQQELANIDNTDLNALWLQNPDEARRISDYRSSLATQLTRIQQATAAKEVEAEHATAAEAARRMEAGKTKVAQAIPDFDEQAIVEYAISKGIDKQSAENWALNPIVTMMAHNSMRYEEMLNKAQATKKRVPEPAKPVKPVAKASSGKRTTAEPSDTDDAETWVKKRNRQLAKRNAA